MKNYNEKIIEDLVRLKPVIWENHSKINSNNALRNLELSYQDIIDAEDRLKRFAPLIRKLFPETGDGIIESPLVEAPSMKTALEQRYGKNIKGRLYLKCDNYLKIAGSIKARGGIYEVLKFAEEIAMSRGGLSINDDYTFIAEDNYKKLFSQYKVVVGSTGNLGMSIGIMSIALGFKAVVHMSHDAKEWKKKRLRDLGVTVIEHQQDYGKAVEEGRLQCMKDPYSYFVDDEHSRHLFLGYSVAAIRLKKQLEDEGIMISQNRPLYVYLPCGVGGGPGGITFGLKHIYGDNANCYFVEPSHSPCMLLGMLTQKYSNLNVKDYGIDNITEADGLAVGSPSELVCSMVKNLIDGEYTIDDNELFALLALLKDTENIKIEPSSASALKGPTIVEACNNAVHICWMTGGIFVPDDIYTKMYMRGKNQEIM
jgi:D-serine ammonia-lyase